MGLRSGEKPATLRGMMLAERWRGDDCAGWWLAEKFDGVRAFWDGAILRTRTWREIHAPAWFLAALPAGVALDGELFGGYGTLSVASDLSRFWRADDPRWRQFTFRAFDWPTTEAVAFERRVEQLTPLANEILQPVQLRRCEGAEDAQRSLAAVVAAGGEGLMLKRPGHCYEFGRSRAWLKVKPVGVE